MSTYIRNILIPILILFIVSGCATSTSHQPISTTALPRPYPQGTYHTVVKGQTLWRIAKAYDADIQEIIERNRLGDPTRIDAGQKLFIPGARKTVNVAMMASTPQTKSKRGYIWPMKGKIRSYYGSKIDSVATKGIVIEAIEGQDIVAARAGKVVFCDEKVKGLGKTLIIDHGDTYATLYAHNSENLVACGDSVQQNQVIAKAGNTGRAKKPGLHFQIRKGHKPQNPFYYLP